MTHEPLLLDVAKRGEVEQYLLARRLVSHDGVPVEISSAGAGNMNLTLRVAPARGPSFIVKQGRPWVEKYPTIPAPQERTLVEAAFYEEAQREPRVARLMPAVLHVDRANRILVLEDLGLGGDFTSIYAGSAMAPGALARLIDWLADLAALSPPDRHGLFANRAMRALNHEHMFGLPLREGNGLDLDGITPGLGAAARELAAEPAYAAAVTALGHRYLADGPALVHGDYFPGSWLRAADGVRVIDPEFCFLGDAEFDYGILGAHLILAGSAPALLAQVAAAVDTRRLNSRLVAGYAGVEIMRRLIGVAQLPVPLDIERKRALLRLSRRLVLEPHQGLP